MEIIINKEIIKNFIQLLPTIQTQLTTITIQIKEYLQYLHQSNFVIDENDSDENKLIKSKNVFQSLQQLIEKRKNICSIGVEINGIVDTIKEKVNEMIQKCFNESESIEMI